jgi:hypothetical protein
VRATLVARILAGLVLLSSSANGGEELALLPAGTSAVTAPDWIRSLVPPDSLRLAAPWPGAPGDLALVVAWPIDDGTRLRILRASREQGVRPHATLPLPDVADARLEDVTGDGKAELILLARGPQTGHELLVLDLAPGRPATMLAESRVEGIELVDADADGKTDLVARIHRENELAVVPIVFRAVQDRLVPARAGLDGFYRMVAKLLESRVEREPKISPRVADLGDRLVEALDLAALYEHVDRKSDAIRVHQRVLEAAQVPMIVDRDTAAERGAMIELARVSRTAIARLAGLRVLGSPGGALLK